MKEFPLLFSGAMVRAILSGQKTQTRRPARPDRELRPPCAPGDLAWVRETHLDIAKQRSENGIVGAYQSRIFYAADGLSWDFYGEVDDPQRVMADAIRWTPSIHMPRWASRITLPIVDVRVERVQSITEADARAEGVTEWNGDEPLICEMARSMGVSFEDCLPSFAALWITTYGREAWETNPWVWVIRWEKAEVRK